VIAPHCRRARARAAEGEWPMREIITASSCHAGRLLPVAAGTEGLATVGDDVTGCSPYGATRVLLNG